MFNLIRSAAVTVVRRSATFNIASRTAVTPIRSVRLFNSDASAPPAGTGRPAQTPVDVSGLPRFSGSVKWFDSGKGFGFITKEDGTDVFVHFTGIRGSGYRSLEEGQKVEFALVNSRNNKGAAAADVVPMINKA